MRRISTKSLAISAANYRLPAHIPPAEELRRFASECRDMARAETDGARRRLFREMESAWLALSAQVERTDGLIMKIRALQRQSMN